MNKPHVEPSVVAEYQSLQGQADFDAAIERDFGTAVKDHQDGFSRRRWLQLMGASLALGSAAGCRYQSEQIAAFAFRPEGRIPGVAEKYASMIDFGGVGQPLLATCSDGRPIKLDGNPKHASCSFDVDHAHTGASSTFIQAKILEFYDPDRLRRSSRLGSAAGQFDDATHEQVVAHFQPLLSASDLSKVAVLSSSSSSPVMAGLQQQFLSKGGTWVSYSSVHPENAIAGSKQAFGKALRPLYRFEKAKVILSLDADPLMLDQGAVANSVAFSKGRDADSKSMSRLYAIESQFSTTGAAADHRMSVPSSAIPGFLAELIEAIESGVAAEVDRQLPYRQRLFAALVKDLLDNPGEGIVLVGEKQPPEVHAAVHSLNDRLKNNGSMIEFVEVADSGASQLEDLQGLVGQLEAGGVDTLVVVGGNPVYDAPREWKLGDLIAKVKDSVHLTCFKNETSLACRWISAAAHPLESWQAGMAIDGSVLVGQPLVEPLYGGRSDCETVAEFLGLEETDGQQLVRTALDLQDDRAWQRAVHDGFVADSASPLASVVAKEGPKLESNDRWRSSWDGKSLEFVFNTSLSVYDGSLANNSWMLELPNFLTKICWDNVASVSPRTAKALGVKQGTLVTLKVGQAEQVVPINIQPGQADGSVGLEVGWGRTAAGRVGGDELAGIPSVGVDVGPLRSAESWHVAGGLTEGSVVSTRRNYKLALIQEPWEIDKTGRDEIQSRMFRNKGQKNEERSSLLREGTFASYLEFLEKHPIDHQHGHGDDHAATADGSAESAGLSLNPAVGRQGELPVIGSVAFAPVMAGDEHEHHWPEAFHAHHELFDITKGAREIYKEEDVDNKNVWGKTIDLNKCIGCNACVIACNAENNVPVVGKDEAWRGREMHWIRIDRYYGDNLYTDDAEEDDKILVHQPIACQHCENAPCETVCPVAATVHSDEGLNDMIYNRCIGTRYCGNNCPFKVRRFNYFNYSDAPTFIKYPGADKLPPADLAIAGLMMNPEVTVRSRGVMEKCTFCVQRIQNARITAVREGRRPIGPNEITTACQDACPSGAIEFGDLNNKGSRVYQKKENPRAYVMLEDLNIRPRTKYLARVRNPHPALIDRDDRDSVRKKKLVKAGDKTNA